MSREKVLPMEGQLWTNAKNANAPSSINPNVRKHFRCFSEMPPELFCVSTHLVTRSNSSSPMKFLFALAFLVEANGTPFTTLQMLLIGLFEPDELRKKRMSLSRQPQVNPRCCGFLFQDVLWTRQIWGFQNMLARMQKITIKTKICSNRNSKMQRKRSWTLAASRLTNSWHWKGAPTPSKQEPSPGPNMFSSNS